jgi:hypothetical protein
MLPVIFLVSYIAIAWYDYIYNCDTPMFSGTSPLNITAWGKPQRREGESLDQELIYKKKIYGLHALFIAPLFFKHIWSVVLSVSLLVLMYHGLRLFYPRCKDDYLKIVYVIHLLGVFPLLFYIGWMGSKSDNRVWSPLLSLSVIVFLYHGMRYFYPREGGCKK